MQWKIDCSTIFIYIKIYVKICFIKNFNIKKFS